MFPFSKLVGKDTEKMRVVLAGVM